VQNNQNLQILFALLFPIRFSLKKYPSEMKFAPKKHHFFYYLGRKIIHQRAVLSVAQIGRFALGIRQKQSLFPLSDFCS
jgi:hypothetical protein